MSDTATQTQMEHAPGSFCWIELATTDGPGAKKFYSELFGWEAQDSPIGPDMVYTTLELDGKDVARVAVKASPKPVYDKDGHLYIRAGNSTRPLNPKETVDYCKLHWSDK